MWFTKKQTTLTITIDNAAQYNKKRESLYISLLTWIYGPLQTDKMGVVARLITESKWARHKEPIANYYRYTSSDLLIDSHVIQPGSDPDKF